MTYRVYEAVRVMDHSSPKPFLASKLFSSSPSVNLLLTLPRFWSKANGLNLMAYRRPGQSVRRHIRWAGVMLTCISRRNFIIERQSQN